MVDADLVARWRSAQGATLAATVLERLMKGESLDGLPLARCEGRIDLRGFCVPGVDSEGSPVGAVFDVDAPHATASRFGLVNTVDFDGVTVAGVDLRGAEVRSWRLFNTTLRDCRFDGADCYDWRVWAATVTDCSFAGARLAGASLGPWYGGRVSRWERVNFAGADMAQAGANAARFVDCDFSNATLHYFDDMLEMNMGTEFGGSHFVRCRFAGPLHGVQFCDLPSNWDGSDEPPKDPEPNPMEDVDFSAAELYWVEFRNLVLDRVRWPEDGDHVVIPHQARAVLGRAKELIAELGTPHTAGLSRRLAIGQDRWHPKREVAIWHRSDLGNDELEQEAAVRILRRAERDVLG